MLTYVDIAIAGGGPAGSVTGMCLARMGWRVAIFEATAFDKDRPGETLPPEINPVLRELGLWREFESLHPVESPGVISAWAAGLRADETDFAFHPHGCGWHIDRCRFDGMLFEAAGREGVSTFSGQRAAFSKQSSEWQVKRPDGSHICAQFAIDATGRNGLRMEGSRERIVDDLLLATVLRLCYADSQPRDLRTLIEAGPSGWWYSAALAENESIAMFFTGRESFRRGSDFIREQLASAPLTRSRLGNVLRTPMSVVPVTSSIKRRIVGEDCLAVGDSACSFDPLSGRGIFKALRHGAAAAKAVHRALRGEATALDRYANTIRQEFDAYRERRGLFYASQRGWRDSPFWKSRTGASGILVSGNIDPRT